MSREHHPIADLFPMLAEDELRELAADIKQRGQLQPITLDGEGRILDGRNRNAACELAGIEPEFTTYEGDDPGGYALAVNIHRRSMTDSQRAIVVARAVRVIGITQREGAQRYNLYQSRIGQANTVLDYAPELADEVLSGARPLSEALRVAKDRKDEADSEAAKLAELRKLNPQLAVLVENGVRELEDALKEAGLRVTVADVDKILTTDEAPEPTFTSRAQSGSITWDEAATLAGRWKTERDEQLRRDKGRLDAFLRGLEAALEVRRKTGSQYTTDLLALLNEDDRAELQDFVSKIKD